MKQKTKNRFYKTVLGVLSAGCLLPMSANSADVNISAVASISNMYLWRGNDLGNGDAMLYGSVKAELNGLYAQLDAESGDNVNGNEYDIYVGFSKSYNDFSFGASIGTYMYHENDNFDTFGKFSELFLNLGYLGFNFTLIDNIAGVSGYKYYNIAYSVGQFGFALGMHDQKQPSKNTVLSTNPSAANYAGKVPVDYTHFDITYNYNKRLAFTLSKVIHQDSIKVGSVSFDHNQANDVLVKVGYSLPLDI